MERVTVYRNNVSLEIKKTHPTIYQIDFHTEYGNNVVALINGSRGHLISRMFTSLDCSSSSFLTLKTRTTMREKEEAVNNVCRNDANTKRNK